MIRGRVLSLATWLWAPFLVVVLGVPASALAAGGVEPEVEQGIVAARACVACLSWEGGGAWRMTSGEPLAAAPGAAHAVTVWGAEGELPPAWAPAANGRSAELQVADASPEWMTDEEKRAQLKERQRSLDRQLLETQRARFVARARNDSPEEIERLEKTFEDLQAERRKNLDRLRSLGTLN